MKTAYYIGSYREDGLNDPNRGWIVGKFKDSKPRKNDAVEIKYWEFDTGSTNHNPKTSTIIECTFILEGITEGFIGDQKVRLKAGNYVVIEPGTPSNIVENIIEKVKGLTIKAPSDPSAKKEINLD